MELARPAIARLELDPKRIAATSVAIAVHVVVLMMLMLPAQIASKPVVEETVTTVQFEPIVRPPPPPPPPPDETHVIQRARETPQSQPQHVPIVYETASAVSTPPDNVTIDEPPVGDFQIAPQPSFAQIRASFAPVPTYPTQALRMRQSGLVMLKLLVDEQGKATEGAIETSSGSRILDEAALKFVLKRWRFFPAEQEGKAIQAWVLVPISFELPR